MPPWNGCPGLITTVCWSPSATFRQPKLRQTTIVNFPSRPSRPDSQPRASVIPGAVHVAAPFPVPSLSRTSKHYLPPSLRGLFSSGARPWAAPRVDIRFLSGLTTGQTCSTPHAHASPTPCTSGCGWFFSALSIGGTLAQAPHRSVRADRDELLEIHALIPSVNP